MTHGTDPAPDTTRATTPTATSSPTNGPTSSPLRRRTVLAWSLWDWGSAAFNAVVTTFVFTRWITSSAFVEAEVVDAAEAGETGQRPRRF